MPQTLSPTQKFSKNLQTTSTGIRFGRALFSQGNGSLSPRLIANTLRLLGLNVPKEVFISLEVAQAIVSGCALWTAVETYEDMNDALEIVNASASTVSAMVSIATMCGWLDEKNQFVQMIEVGTDIAMIVGSAGENVGAWLSLAVHVANFESMNQARAAQIAHQALTSTYHMIFDPQAAAAASVLKQYQESKDKSKDAPDYLSVFGFVGKMASVAPDLWPQYFPNFGWMPETVRSISVQGSSTTWYGSTETKKLNFSWTALYKMDDAQIRSFVFNNLCYATIYPFQIAEKAFHNQNKAQLFSTPLLATLNSLKYINSSQDLSAYLDAGFLTPFDLSDTFIQDYLDTLPDPQKGLTTNQFAISIGGRGVVKSKGSVGFQDQVYLYEKREYFKAADRLGRIDVLRGNQILSEKIKAAYTFPDIPYDQALGAWNEVGPQAPYGGRLGYYDDLVRKNVGAGKAWRDPRNYFAALSMINTLKHDSFFKDSELIDWLNQNFGFMKDIDFIEKRHREIQMKQTVRAVNLLALQNIAKFFGTDSDKLLRKTDLNGIVHYDVKGH